MKVVGGYFREYEVPSHLRRWVRCYWSLKLDVRPSEDPQAASPFMGRPYPELVISLAGTYKWSDPVKQVVDGPYSSCRFFGPRVGARNIVLENDLHIWGVQFQPSLIWSVLDLAPSDLNDASVAIEEIRAIHLQDLSNRLILAISEDERVRICNQWFNTVLANFEEDHEAMLFQQIVQDVMKFPMLYTEEKFIGISERTVQRKFMKYVGMSFRELHQLARLYKVLNQIYVSDRVAEVASTYGFYDQAHFSKTFKQLAGLTPREFREKNQWSRHYWEPGSQSVVRLSDEAKRFE